MNAAESMEEPVLEGARSSYHERAAKRLKQLHEETS